jgi:RNA polymerase sigma factor (sigma-70 family)
LDSLFLQLEELKNELRGFCVNTGVLPAGHDSLFDLSHLKKAVEHLDNGWVSETLDDIDDLRNQILEKNYGLIHMVLNQYGPQGSLYEDLFQEGVFGLMRAIDKFDVNRKNAFSSYAVWWIKEFIGIHFKKIRKAIDSCVPIEDTKHKTFPDKDAVSAFDEILKNQMFNIVKGVVEKVLTDRESRIITHRFDLEGTGKKTLQELAFDEKMSKEAVRLIEKKALKEIKNKFFKEVNKKVK